MSSLDYLTKLVSNATKAVFRQLLLGLKAKMEPKHLFVLGLILIPYVLSDRQCTESGQRIVNAHIENVVDNVSTSSPFYIFVFTCTKYVHNLCKVSIFYPNLQTLDDRTYDLDNVVRASSQVLKEVLLPQIEQMFDLKIGQMKTELKQELIGTVNEVKDDLMIQGLSGMTVTTLKLCTGHSFQCIFLVHISN